MFSVVDGADKTKQISRVLPVLQQVLAPPSKDTAEHSHATTWFVDTAQVKLDELAVVFNAGLTTTAARGRKCCFNVPPTGTFKAVLAALMARKAAAARAVLEAEQRGWATEKQGLVRPSTYYNRTRAEFLAC